MAWSPQAIQRCSALAAFLAVASRSFAAPDIESITPRALQPGVPIEMKFDGSELAEATNIWANFPGRFEALGDGRFRITADANRAVGIGTLRLYGTHGASSANLVMIDDLPTVAESGTNNTQASAQLVKSGTAIDGRCDELGYDWSKFRAGKGQRVAIEVVANRLGSRLDSVLRIFDETGKQLAQNDDAPGLRGDSFISFVAPKSGDYFIELRDVNYGGGSGMFYRLRIGEFALATVVFPAHVQAGARKSFQLSGPGVEAARIEASAPSNSNVLPIASKGRAGSAFARAFVGASVEIIESEPNDTVSKPTKVSTDAGINGRFDKDNDRDCYEFTARKNERLEFRAATRSLGSPCDAILEIQSMDGKMLARSNPTAGDEGIVSHKFAADGSYCLMVEEATGASGPNCVYHVSAQPAAGFGLTIESDTFNVTAGKTFDLKVSIIRGDYKGAVKLALEGIDSLAWTNHVIAEGKSNATMKVTLPEGLAPGTLQFLSVFGTARRDGQDVRVRPVLASPPSGRRRAPPPMPNPLPEFSVEVALGIMKP
jgi:hypothetical protein